MEKRKFKVIDIDNSFVDKLVALYFSLFFLLLSFISSLILGEKGEVWKGLFSIISSPSPLVTDYFRLGGLSSAFLNAGLCGISCTLLMFLLKAKCNYSTYAGFFLVVAHCFYGLNILNMWPPMLGILVYTHIRRENFGDYLSVAFYSTAFAPFISEILFRYPLTSSQARAFTLPGLIVVILFSIFIGFAIPAMLKGAKLLHREMSLYNGGLAFGLLGMFLYSFMYNIMGVTPQKSIAPPESSSLFGREGILCNLFFFLVFSIAIIVGWFLNGRSFEGLGKLMKDPGFKSDFLEKYGDGVTMINLGVYGMMMVLCFDLCILLTDGVGWTGATCGIVLASVAFTASGQNIRNVWPVLSGYVLLYVFVSALSKIFGFPISWTLSTQAFMNGAAFATGLCPFTGRYGKRYGAAAGFVSAVLCTATSVMHGGFMLYNGGLVAGLSAMILSPLIDHYSKRGEKLEGELMD